MACSNKNQKEEVATNPKLDSIQQWINLAQKSKDLSLEDRTFYLKKAEKEALTQTNDTIILEQLSKVTLEYYKMKDSLNFRRSNKVLLGVASKAKAFKIEGYAHWDLAEFLQFNGILDSAYSNYRNALRSFERLPVDSTSKSLKARMYYGMARIQDSYKDYLGAETNVAIALKIFDDLGDNGRIYNCYNLLGVVAGGLGNSVKSLEYYDKARITLELMEPSEKTTQLIWQNKNNTTSVYLRNEDYDMSKKLYQELLKSTDLKEKKPELYSLALAGLAYSIFKTDKDYDKVEALLKESIEVNIEFGKIYDLARPKQFYAELLAAKGDTTQAIQNAKESFAIAKETYNNDRLLNALSLLTNIDPKNAAKYANDYYTLNETIQEEERTKRDKFARISWETDQIIEENQVLTEEKQMWAGAVFGLVVFGFAFISIVILYINNNRLKFKQKQQESNQEIYNLMLSQQGKFEEGKQLEQKRISEELHDGILGEMLGIRLILSGLNEREDMASVAQRADLIEKLRGVEEEIRTISHELNSAAYKKFHNFIVSLEDMIGDIEQSSGITCSFTYDNEVSWDNLLGDIKINAYRIVQEALKNCIKHAESQRVTINFQQVGDNLQLTIADDGVGFDVNKGRKGIGLKNIISRTKKVKGTVDIDSKKGTGTTITVTIPARFIELNVMEQTANA
ncbi:tetratricopeptide repeat-containing sensor histidine kinase [Flagellimonas beolgyonensis]|uniref:tetratricopeptide repeat-containing sensor histidine kinase n=1 Tax=Flagellimonas beolgyonensis TaxID=864064 RepID=UPI000F8D9FBA|nr:ATP-binding protein [Allomuricauda beolgyonensis]